MDSLSIFMPFYNDAGTVRLMISDAYRYGKNLTEDLEVIAVNDGSRDHTLKELRKLRKEFPSLKIIFHKRNQGYGAALISGIRNSTKEWVFYTDGDAQYNLDELAKLWEKRYGKDVINGYKIRRSDNILRRAVGTFYARTIKRIFNTPIKDVDCDYRLVRGNLLRSLDLQCKSGAITVELVKKLSLRTKKFHEIGVSHYPRQYGKSTFFTPKNIIQTIFEEMKLLQQLTNLRSER